MDQRVSIITLGVADLSASRAFYARLGWQEAESSSDSIAFFQLKGSALALYEREALLEDANFSDRQPRAPGAVTLAINFGSQEEVDRAMEEAKQAGATVLKAPQPAFWGGYSGYFADPDGHPWELAHSPFSSVESDGSFTI